MRIKQTKTRRRTGDRTIHAHHGGTCRATGLVRYRDTNQASDALISIRRSRMRAVAAGLDPRPAPVRWFPCVCGGFHLTGERLAGMTGEAA